MSYICPLRAYTPFMKFKQIPCLLAVALLGLIGCTKVETFDVQFFVPKTIEVLREGGSPISLSLKILAGKAPLKTDKVVFKETSGVDWNCPITEVGAQKFSISLDAAICGGEYDVYIQRGSQRKLMGATVLSVKDPSIQVADGVTVYGKVLCEGKGVSGAVVSDGYQVVKTDEAGLYQMKSSKALGYVFLSVPSGYDVPSDGILPKFHRSTSKSSSESEQLDFTLSKAPSQQKFTLLVFGDIHLANRNNDRQQFAQFTSDVNSYLGDHSGETIYGLTLGDMTWDLYWTSNRYEFDQYLTDANAIKGLSIYHTIGNHDHEMMAKGDFDTVTKYRKSIAPNYYSTNIGSWHIVVLDDIECTNNGSGDRTYNEDVVNEEIEWLKKDLAFVSKSTPILVSLHAPVFSPNGGNGLKNTPALLSALEGYEQVQIVSGHSHKMYNVSKGDIYEHNSGAVCATWWWSGKLSGINICQDGTPGGYRILTFDGDKASWQYKGTQMPVEHQFNSFDRNSMDLSAENYLPKGADANKSLFNLRALQYVGPSSANEVYINVWDWDPSWSVSVKENGTALKVEQLSAAFDPLHLVAYTAPRLNTSEDNTSLSFQTSATGHIFKATATSATSTLEISVTDRFGRTYTENMTRPKAFNIEAYK